MRILYIDGVGAFGGASKSLYEVLSSLHNEEIELYFLCSKGTAAAYYSSLTPNVLSVKGISRFDNTQYSRYVGYRWLALLREIMYVPFTIYGIVLAKYKWKNIDVVHANEVTELFPALIAKILFSSKLVVHVRSVQDSNHKSYRTRFIHYVLKKNADAIIPIDENVAASIPWRDGIEIIHNSFEPSANQGTDNVLRRKIHDYGKGYFKVAFVGNLQYSKGVIDFVKAAKIALSRRNNIVFFVVGGRARKSGSFLTYFLNKTALNQDVYHSIVNFIDEYKLSSNIYMLGHTYDVSAVYSSIDLLCNPGHFNAPGRQIFEAAFYSVPSIVCIDHPKNDTFVHGHTGLSVRLSDPADIADAIVRLYDDREYSDRLGENAYNLALENFTVKENSRKLHSLYSRLIN